MRIKTNIFILGLFMMVLANPVPAQVQWTNLDRNQKSISADTFSRLLHDVFSPDGGMISYLRYNQDSVSVYSTPAQTGSPLFVLQFAESDIPVASKKFGGEKGPLSGLRIALDPGHIGGAWSRMEERYFLVDRERDWPVQEGAINLYVARLLRERLSAAGAEVVMVKDDLEPMTSVRSDELMKDAGPLPPPDPRFSNLPELFVESSRRDAQRKSVERQFYRVAEIAARADRINNEIKPDVTLCVHFNATGYGDEKTLYDENGLVFFVTGNFQAGEIVSDEQKYFLLNKLLERSHEVELPLAHSIADAFAKATGLQPSYRNSTEAMKQIGTNRYVFARNLSASRQFNGPVIFLEPYFMNNRTVYARIQQGDYEGEREIDGKKYPSIFREYADAVTAGILAYYR
jgi:N-acetylmuramoyl-L-alanine amidase